MSAAALKERLRADLKTAMQARASDEVRLLRTLIAALDNAEAVPTAEAPDRTFVVRRVGDDAVEVPRLDLDTHAVERLLQAEIDARLAAAADYERHGENDAAARLRYEADLIARYCNKGSVD